MPRFENQDLSFDYPRDWEDRSVVAFAAPSSAGKPTATNIVVTRDKLGDEEDVKRYADRQLVEMARRLDGFQLIARNEMSVDGEPAVDVKFGWRGSAGPLVQRLTMVAKDRRVLNVTCTAAKKDAPEFGPIFDRVVASIKLSRG